VEQIALQWDAGPRVLSVSEVTGLLREVLDREFGTVWISGEISGCKVPASGHFYFTLKDAEAQLKAVCYRSTARYLKFKPRDGVAVIARGRLDVYSGRGEYQLIVETLEPQGYGALQFAYEQLKKKLAMEGLFEPSRKRSLPRLPMRIGLVTSPTGAVVQDILNILKRRFPGLHIRLYPAQVQGEGSVEAVSSGVEYFSSGGWADVVIVARGGGSLEDLWTFNEERVARAIASSAVPVISAVGHETDFTIADFVADLRAPTPSAAAELVICTREQLLEQIATDRAKLEQAMRYRIAMSGRRLHQLGVDRAVAVLHRTVGRRFQRVDEFDYRLREAIRAGLAERKHQLNAVSLDRAGAFLHRLIGRRAQYVSDLEARLRDRARMMLESGQGRLRDLDTTIRRHDVRVRFSEVGRRLDNAETMLAQSIRLRLASAHNELAPKIAQLRELSPMKILERGYAIVRNESGTLVKSPADAPLGSEVRIHLAHGKLDALVTKATPGDSSELPS
jgi:exodeoxyribonuclease VII large subunit